MRPLELTVTEEQVKDWLRADARVFYDDWDSPRSYLYWVQEASRKGYLIYQCTADEQVEPVQEYCSKVDQVSSALEYSFDFLGGRLAEERPEEAGVQVDLHYEQLVQLPLLQAEGLELDVAGHSLLEPTIPQIVGLLIQQTLVANLLFNPETRTPELLEMMRDCTKFLPYIEQEAAKYLNPAQPG